MVAADVTASPIHDSISIIGADSMHENARAHFRHSAHARSIASFRSAHYHTYTAAVFLRLLSLSVLTAIFQVNLG